MMPYKINSKFQFENNIFQITKINDFHVRCIILNEATNPNTFNENMTPIAALTENSSEIKDFSIDEINAIFKNKEFKNSNGKN